MVHRWHRARNGVSQTKGPLIQFKFLLMSEPVGHGARPMHEWMSHMIRQDVRISQVTYKVYPVFGISRPIATEEALIQKKEEEEKKSE